MDFIQFSVEKNKHILTSDSRKQYFRSPKGNWAFSVNELLKLSILDDISEDDAKNDGSDTELELA